MKVAFIGNMNNNFFAVARYLRDRDIDVSVLPMMGEPAHFGPEADCYTEADLEIVKPLAWGTRRKLLSLSQAAARDSLKPYDFLVGCGLAPAYVHRMKRRLDVFVPYGDDIWSLCGFAPAKLKYRASNRLMAVWQKPGIRESRVIHMIPTNNLYESAIKRLPGDWVRWTEGFPMTYLKMYDDIESQSAAQKTQYYDRFRNIRQSSELMVVAPSRHSWGGSPDDSNQKGTDALLRGWSQFVKNNSNRKCTIVFFEYGPQVSESKSLLEDLGVSDTVEWVPVMQRKELMPGIAMADVSCGEFQHSWICGGVLYEAMTVATPLLAYRDDSLYDEQECYPIYNARQSDEIAAAFQKILDDPEEAAEMGRFCQKWYQESVINPVIDRYETFIKTGNPGSS